MVEFHLLHKWIVEVDSLLCEVNFGHYPVTNVQWRQKLQLIEIGIFVIK